MSQFEVIMPKLGESITEATITKWFKKENDLIDEDEVLLEIATDKVDSEIPSPVAGKIVKILYKEGDVVPVGKIIAVISLSGEDAPEIKSEQPVEKAKPEPEVKTLATATKTETKSDRFYSPLVRTIAKEEKVSIDELESIPGTGQNGRVRKEDILNYVQNKSTTPKKKEEVKSTSANSEIPIQDKSKVPISVGAEDEIVEMDRMRRIIADHMVMSKHTAPHVTNFVEADVTNLVFWRNKVKDEFQRREKINLTYMPIFLEAVVNALKEFPQVNASVDGYKIILRKNINLGVAVSLPSGSLIVPVIKNADNLSLLGITKEMNRLAEAARNNKLSPDEIQGGTLPYLILVVLKIHLVLQSSISLRLLFWLPEVSKKNRLFLKHQPETLLLSVIKCFFH